MFTPLASSTGSSTCPSSAVLTTQVPNQPQVSQPQPDPNGPVLIICNDQEQEICSKESGTNAEDDIKDGMDTTPVRDISCETSNEKLTVLNHNAKPTSPEKTTQKVMTVKYLLGELKTLVANQDSDAVRLISEVEQSISLLPVMVGSTNIQAEIALALQPLRSENVQLRRRLRILNQQLSERERAERRNRPEACDMEVVVLQSLNLTLQTQLNESRRELDDLQQENMRLQKAMEDKDGDLKHHKDVCELENSRIRLEVSAALAEMQSCQSKLGKYETEKLELTLSLKYMGHAFEKLDVQDVKNDGRDYDSDHHGMALHLNQKNKGLNNQLVESQHARQCLRMGVQTASTGHPSVTENTFSSCDIKSLASDWSINSWSTFNTQDEQNFRDGLTALDASIESLQKTLRVDLKK
uniref:Coiled-coil domain containing 14 n=2 Tax=Cyprinus carpio TaxID=7962 RepID=A0A8C1APL9_CYPCA